MDTQTTEDLLNEFGSLPGNLQLTQVVGRGGSGVVLRALELTMDRPVAIKILFNKDAESSQERFEREMKVLASLDHPNIVKSLTSGRSSKGNRYFTMEWLEGLSLAEQLQHTPVLADKMFFEIFSQLLSALQYAHSKNVVHRDIKPSNIMLCQNSDGSMNAKLVDFGIARQLEGGESIGLTKSRAIIGTPLYMSPEQAAACNVQAASDIYSLACVMYQCLCGRPPFEGDSEMDILYKHAHDTPAKLGLEKAGEQLEKLLSRCLAKVADDRPGANETSAELKKIELQYSGKITRTKNRKQKEKNLRLVSACLFLAVSVLVLVHGMKGDTEKSKNTTPQNDLEQFRLQADIAKVERQVQDFSKSIDREQKRLDFSKAVGDDLLDNITRLETFIYDRIECYSDLSRKKGMAYTDKDGLSYADKEEADCKRILAIEKKYDPQGKFLVKVRALEKLAEVQYMRGDGDGERVFLNQAIEAAKQRHPMLETDLLMSRSRMFLRQNRYKEADADTAQALRIWSDLGVFTGGQMHLNSPQELEAKVIGATGSFRETCQHSRSIEQQADALKNMLLLHKFLLARGSIYAKTSLNDLILSSKAVPDDATVCRPYLNEVYTIAAKDAASRRASDEEQMYKKLAAKFH